MEILLFVCFLQEEKKKKESAGELPFLHCISHSPHFSVPFLLPPPLIFCPTPNAYFSSFLYLLLPSEHESLPCIFSFALPPSIFCLV